MNIATDIDIELQRTQPDYVVYKPASLDGSTYDTGNEHFLVFEGPDGSFMAVWTQSSFENAGDHRIVFARSDDEGVTWTKSIKLAGPDKPGRGIVASWGFPMTSKSGRIYVVYNQTQGIVDAGHAMTGTMDCVYSDDMGQTWSAAQTIPMQHNRYDHPDHNVPANWIVWQRPIRDLNGRWFTGYTHWVSQSRRTPRHNNSWTTMEAVVEFMRYENIDDDPEPRDIQISYSNPNAALRVPHYTNPLLSIAQEPSIVRLPDDRLFCVMRTMSGYIWYSVSADDGYTWSIPAPLLRRDKGQPILEPLCCCPIYQLSDGRYVLLHHNNDGRVNGSLPEQTMLNRAPAFIALGEFRPNAEQPIWFSESKQLMHHDWYGIGPAKRMDLGVYPSFTTRGGNDVLWHPDRKFFLLGKRITREWLADLTVPSA